MSKKKLYYQVSHQHREFDYLIFLFGDDKEFDRMMDQVGLELEDMDDEDQEVTIKIISLSDKAYKKILENSED